jgi:polar amino acid transport system substrate-binding protein
MKRSTAVAVTVLAGAALAGCGAASDTTLRATLAALETRAPLPPASPPSPPARHCRAVTASLRPSKVTPRPRAMPSGSFMAKIERRGYLLAGVDQNTLLFAYFNPVEQRAEGFEIDLLREVAKAIFGNPDMIRFKAITAAERIPAVEDRRVDIVADAMTITCQRRQQVDFSTVYYDARQKLLVRSNSTVRSVGDLGRRHVCAAAGTTSIETLQRRAPRAIVYPVPERTDCLAALQEGLVDAITSDDAILLGFKAQDPYTRVVGSALAHEPYGMAISKAHPDFVRFVNGVLARMRADGTWRKIYSRWFGTLTATPTPPTAAYLR